MDDAERGEWWLGRWDGDMARREVVEMVRWGVLVTLTLVDLLAVCGRVGPDGWKAHFACCAGELVSFRGHVVAVTSVRRT